MKIVPKIKANLIICREILCIEIPDFQAGDIAVVHLDDITLRVGIVSYENNQPILLTSDVTNFENLRAVTND